MITSWMVGVLVLSLFSAGWFGGMSSGCLSAPFFGGVSLKLELLSPLFNGFPSALEFALLALIG